MSAFVVRTRKRTLAVMALLSAGVGSLGGWLVTLPNAEIGLIGKLAVCIGIPLFGFSTLYFSFRLLSGKPAVVLDAAGFLDNASAVSAGLIPWAEINCIRVSSYGSQRFLAIFVNDQEKYLRRANPIKKLVMRANKVMLGTAITIPLTALSVSLDELFGEMEKYFHDDTVDG